MARRGRKIERCDKVADFDAVFITENCGPKSRTRRLFPTVASARSLISYQVVQALTGHGKLNNHLEGGTFDYG